MIPKKPNLDIRSDFLYVRSVLRCTKFLFQEICLAAYRGVVQPESEDKRIISAQWATDEDISRLLKSLPNWQLAVSDTPSIIEGGGASPGGGSGGPQNVSAESPQEVEQRNARVSHQMRMYRQFGIFKDATNHWSCSQKYLTDQYPKRI